MKAAGISGSPRKNGNTEIITSHILKAIGLPPELSHGSLRVSFSRFNTKEEVEGFIEALIPGVARLREFSPIREGGYFANTEEDDHHHDIPEDDW